MNALSTLIALLTILAAGGGIALALFRPSGKIALTELLPLAWLLGAAFVSLALACGGIVVSGVVLHALVAAACIALGFFGLQSLRKKQVGITFSKPSGALEIALCFLILIQFAVVLWLACRESLGWDGLLVWEIKARYAFLNGGAMPHRYFTDSTRAWSHPEYPLLLPLTETWLYLWIGDCDQFWVRSIFPAFYFAAALLLYSGASRLTGKKWTGLTAAALLFFIPFPVVGRWNLFAGYADFPLGVFYLAAVVWFLRMQREPSRANAILFAILAGAMPWMKREGTILWACIIAVACIGFLRRKNFAHALLTPLPGLAVCIGWKLASKAAKAPDSADYLPMTLANLHKNLPRTGPILRHLGSELADLGNWSILWFALPVALVCIALRGDKKTGAQLFALTALPLAFYSGIYIFSSWPEYLSHIQVSLPRLVLQVSLAALLAISLAVGGEKAPPQP
jgi:hypothetical protein